jgi:hypothetical protein
MAKHVVVLGAGASSASGYPLAKGLYSILTSAREFETYVDGELGDLDSRAELRKRLLDAFVSYERTGAGCCLREGNYNSVDEFCYLLAKNEGLRVLTDNLKWFIALVFALHRPVDWLGKQTANSTSDYFPFVQRLFNNKICELRDDFAVLTYNYDPFLEFALCKEFEARQKAVGRERGRIPASLLSGFDHRKAPALAKDKGFCLLKLHGTSVIPSLDSVKPNAAFARMHSIFTFYNVFTNRETELSQALKQFNATYHRPPTIYFPWELVTENGNLRRQIRESEVGGVHQRVGEQRSKTADKTLFKAIWKRAQREITDSEKISFIGLSTHHFMKSGFKYLFKERIKRLTAGENLPLNILTANPDKGQVAKIESLLREACPEVVFGEVGYRPSFADFIQHEM